VPELPDLLHIVARLEEALAGSVVTGEIPEFSVAVGNPARVVRHYEDGAWARAQRAGEG